jgi:hypothetical protein
MDGKEKSQTVVREKIKRSVHLNKPISAILE